MLKGLTGDIFTMTYIYKRNEKIGLLSEKLKTFLTFAVKDFLSDHSIDVILGPYDDATGIVADKLRIPYISTTGSKRNLKFTFQILPPLEDFSQAIFDMTKSYKWDKVSLFYDDLRGKPLRV